MPEPLLSLWNRLDRRARLVVLVAGGLCLAGLLALTRLQGTGEYVPLYSALAAEDAAAVVEQLKAERTPYRLTRNGTTIEVPASRVHETRLALAREGLPHSGQIGFEVFDRSGLPGTQFSNRVNYQRALQGELARTLGAMGEIRSARVHLVLPEENLFAEKTRPRASVVLQLRPGAALDRQTTAAVVHVVSSAVQDLSPSGITLVDESGRVLHGSEEGQSLGGLTAGQLEQQQQFEARLCSSLQSMLDAVIGPHKSVVRVQAKLNFDAEEIKSESVVPVAEGKGLVASEKLTQEQYEGAGEGGSPLAAAGLEGNLAAGAAAGGGRTGSYVQRDESREYEFSRNVTSLVKAPGQVKTLHIAAVVDESLDRNAQEQIRQVLQAAAGVNEQRGDVVTVERMKMEAALAAEEESKNATVAEKSERRQQLWQTALRSGLNVAAGLLVLISSLFVLRQFKPAAPVAGETAGEGSAAASLPLNSEETLSGVREILEAAVSGQLPEGETGQQAYELPPRIEPQINESLREQLRQLTQEDTRAVADRVLQLLQEPRSAN
jgi:flagellar M-ring protein FliF